MWPAVLKMGVTVDGYVPGGLPPEHDEVVEWTIEVYRRRKGD
ncbi:MAG TPA: hypothetical protein VG795_16040 [Acidimicrobiia bacterium]|nr:hypothetical protein [Acidimicrobiia bacterium]